MTTGGRYSPRAIKGDPNNDGYVMTTTDGVAGWAEPSSPPVPATVLSGTIVPAAADFANQLFVLLPDTVVDTDWDATTMIGSDTVHPNNAGMNYLADVFQSTLAAAGITDLASAWLVAYGDSWTAQDIMNTPGTRAIVQLNTRLFGTLVNRAVSGSQCWDVARRIVAGAPYVAGTAGLGFVSIGFNDLLDADTTKHRNSVAAHLRAIFAAFSASSRIENTAFTYGTGWASNSFAGSSGGTNRSTSTNGATATYPITTPGDYYLLCHGADGSASIGGKFTISQAGVDLASIDLNQLSSPSNVGSVAVRIPSVAAGTLTVTFSTEGRTGAIGWLDALLPMSATPPPVLAVKPIVALEPTRDKPALLDYIRNTYDTLAAEFGSHIIVCDPDPTWTP